MYQWVLLKTLWRFTGSLKYLTKCDSTSFYCLKPQAADVISTASLSISLMSWRPDAAALLLRSSYTRFCFPSQWYMTCVKSSNRKYDDCNSPRNRCPSACERFNSGSRSCLASVAAAQNWGHAKFWDVTAMMEHTEAAAWVVGPRMQQIVQFLKGTQR